MGGVEKKKKKLNLDVRNIFAGFCTEHPWGCSKCGQSEPAPTNAPFGENLV
jgi:hypothetical protein